MQFWKFLWFQSALNKPLNAVWKCALNVDLRWLIEEDFYRLESLDALADDQPQVPEQWWQNVLWDKLKQMCCWQSLELSYFSIRSLFISYRIVSIFIRALGALMVVVSMFHMLCCLSWEWSLYNVREQIKLIDNKYGQLLWWTLCRMHRNWRRYRRPLTCCRWIRKRRRAWKMRGGSIISSGILSRSLNLVCSCCCCVDWYVAMLCLTSVFIVDDQWLILLWSPYVIGQTIIFLPCDFYLLSFFSSPNLSGRRLDVYHTSTHGVALVRI